MAMEEMDPMERDRILESFSKMDLNHEESLLFQEQLQRQREDMLNEQYQLQMMMAQQQMKVAQNNGFMGLRRKVQQPAGLEGIQP